VLGVQRPERLFAVHVSPMSGCVPIVADESCAEGFLAVRGSRSTTVARLAE
jgi:hypothetical protein